MNDIRTPKDAACFLLCGLCVVALGWMVVAPWQVRDFLIALLAPIGRVLS